MIPQTFLHWREGTKSKRMSKYHKYDITSKVDRKAKLELLTNLAWMSTDLCWNMQIGIMYTCAKIMPNCQTSMNESRCRTKYFDGKKCGEFVRIGKFGSTFSIWQECQSVWFWNLCHRPFFQARGFFFICWSLRLTARLALTI